MILATITKRKRGFCVQIRRKGYAPISRTFATKADAQEWALEEERKRSSPRVKRLLLDPRKVTLREVLTRYVNEVTPKKISSETEHYRIAKIVRAPITDLSLFDLTPSVNGATTWQRILPKWSNTQRSEVPGIGGLQIERLMIL